MRPIVLDIHWAAALVENSQIGFLDQTSAVAVEPAAAAAAAAQMLAVATQTVVVDAAWLSEVEAGSTTGSTDLRVWTSLVSGFEAVEEGRVASADRMPVAGTGEIGLEMTERVVETKRVAGQSSSPQRRPRDQVRGRRN